MKPLDDRSPLEAIPNADSIRTRLAVLARERARLRELLRIVTKRERDLQTAVAQRDAEVTNA